MLPDFAPWQWEYMYWLFPDFAENRDKWGGIRELKALDFKSTTASAFEAGYNFGKEEIKKKMRELIGACSYDPK